MKLLLMLLCALGIFPATHVAAQGDLVWSERVFPLPDAPAEFRSVEHHQVRWDYPSVAEDELVGLRAVVANAWPRIEDDLGVDVDDAMTIRIARSPEEMAELAPRGLGVPAYAVGVAYPYLGVILLSMDAPNSWEPPDLEEVLAHELSHIALRRAVGGADMPRWFVEGMAIHHADERSLDRFQVLYNAHLQDRLIALHILDTRFPDRVHEVSLAYAQAADVVTFLRRGERARSKMHRLVFELGEGEGFEEAMLESYSLSPTQLEREWKAELDERMSSVPMLVGGGTFWVLAALLLIWAWKRRRARNRVRLEHMADEERAHDDAMNRLEQLVDQRLAEQEAAPVITGAEPQGPRDSGVPTIEIDGSNHTLH